MVSRAGEVTRDAGEMRDGCARFVSSEDGVELWRCRCSCSCEEEELRIGLERLELVVAADDAKRLEVLAEKEA